MLVHRIGSAEQEAEAWHQDWEGSWLEEDQSRVRAWGRAHTLICLSADSD